MDVGAKKVGQRHDPVVDHARVACSANARKMGRHEGASASGNIQYR